LFFFAAIFKPFRRWVCLALLVLRSIGFEYRAKPNVPKGLAQNFFPCAVGFFIFWVSE